MNYPSIHSMLPLACVLMASPSQAMTLASMSCENSQLHVECVISDYSPAAIHSVKLPVLAEEPESDLSVGIFVAPGGQVGGAIGGKSGDAKLLSDSIKLSTFEGAKIAAKPTWSYVRVDANDACFYLDPEQDQPEGIVPPQAEFRMEKANLALLAACTTATPEEPNAHALFRIDIDASGKAVSATALQDFGKKNAEMLLTPMLASMPFKPATVDGKPVPCSIVMSIKALPNSDLASKVPLFMSEGSAQPLPVLPIPYAGEAEKLVKCYLDMDSSGMVKSVRVAPETDTGIALEIIKKLRNWGNPAHFEWDNKMPVAVVTLKLVPGQKELVLAEAPRPIGFKAPSVEKHGFFGFNGLIIGKFENVVATYTILPSGKILDYKTISESSSKYAGRIEGMIEDSKFNPAIVEGEPVSCMITQRSALLIQEWWVNSDSLKW